MILDKKKDWSEAGRIASTAISPIPRACSRKLSRNDQTNALRNISSAAADACSISLRLGLQHIEFGRGLILGYLVDGQSDLSSLEAARYISSWRPVNAKFVSLKDSKTSSCNLLRRTQKKLLAIRTRTRTHYQG
ncbi:hypothetical protein F5B21DRAFT_475467 [Xylaria acuta]|nr:hypothetical protein F5B21DRAFT_475467 [Xylaria acuta]